MELDFTTLIDDQVETLRRFANDHGMELTMETAEHLAASWRIRIVGRTIGYTTNDNLVLGGNRVRNNEPPLGYVNSADM